MPIKVAIVEDDAKVRESLAILINGAESFCCIGAFPSGEVALRQIPQDWPDVVLMDINLVQMSGIECVAILKARRPQLHVIMLTAHEDNELIFNSLKAGASGFLIKRTPHAEILEAIGDVQRGGSPMTGSIARQVVQYFHQKQPANEELNLSARELEVLTLLSRGYQYKEIAGILFISIPTVRNHLQNIYQKLHVRSRTEAVVKFLGRK
ncbi:MAG: response regulator transcription factor [Limisphaerales bacterium]